MNSLQIDGMRIERTHEKNLNVWSIYIYRVYILNGSKLRYICTAVRHTSHEEYSCTFYVMADEAALDIADK